MTKVETFDLSQKVVLTSQFKDTTSFDFPFSEINCYNFRFVTKTKNFSQQMWLNSGKITIKARFSNDELIIDTVQNSSFYYKVKSFHENLSALLKTRDTNLINSFLLKEYEANLNNVFSYSIGMNFLGINQNSKLALLKLKALFVLQGSTFQSFLLYPYVVDRINNILAVDKIDIKNYSFIAPNGEISKIQLGNANHYVLDFWFLNCAPCVREHAEINRTLEKLRSKKVEVIGISIDDAGNLGLLKNYLVKNNYFWSNYIESSHNRLTTRLDINTFPNYILINSKGDITGSFRSFSEILKHFNIE
ncbi:MAG: TlpA family protein disulfide reductase [Vallitaleaceae bacterium]|nr:TlpA family protein disulfide reductase [Vallitaleaceae bacterium]